MNKDTQAGAAFALEMVDHIARAVEKAGTSKEAWWTGFFTASAGMCAGSIGDYAAADILEQIRSVAQEKADENKQQGSRHDKDS